MPFQGCEPELLWPQREVLTTRLTALIVKMVLGTYKIQLCSDLIQIYLDTTTVNKKVALTEMRTQINAATTQGSNHYTIDADS